MRRTIVAGFGNVLRGDDGFGVEVVRRLEEQGLAPEGTLCLEVGTGGLALAQELLTPCDRLVIVDAMARGGAPGSTYVLRVETVGALESLDLHLAVPARVLALAKALGALPSEVYLVGCEPSVVDDLTMELSPAVAQAVEPTVREVKALLQQAAK